jgi:succinyl-diaminopimelate desuccinylase
MKGSIAVFIALLQELGPTLSQYDLGLMVTTDEETGGYHGTGWLLNRGYGGQAVLLPDGGGSWELETQAKGAYHARLTALGRATHGSRPWDGRNALDQLMSFITEVRTHVPTEPCGDPKHLHDTFNLGALSGGSVPNQAPDRAEALIDIRLMPSHSIDKAVEWVRSAQLKHPGVHIEELLAIQGYASQNGPARELFAGVAAATTGRKLPHVMAYGGSDAHYFAEHGLETIVLYPKGGDLKDLTTYQAIVRKFVEQYTRR